MIGMYHHGTILPETRGILWELLVHYWAKSDKPK